MVQYLTKEEVKQWRSSLEKITLEEFARRLGKEIEENKRTHDIVDMLVNNEAVSTTEETKTSQSIKPTGEKFKQKIEEKTETKIIEKSEINVNFSKELTEREQRVFDYLSEKKGQSVKAQELASVLDIPRDYIYKYIRNLRKKMIENLLINSDEGGFILNI